MFPDHGGVNIPLPTTLSFYYLEVSVSRVRRSQVLGEVLVFPHADWNREMSICETG